VVGVSSVAELERGCRGSRGKAIPQRHSINEGERDLQTQWARAWDGQWRLVLFDVPTGQNAQRERLRRSLRDKAFSYLQNSVWITPDPLTEEGQILGGGKINVESLLMLEARPCAGESDAEIVAGAWDFERSNRRYARHLKILGERPGGALWNLKSAICIPAKRGGQRRSARRGWRR
jgi:DNA-binding transcriptional regulator PaaX